MPTEPNSNNSPKNDELKRNVNLKKVKERKESIQENKTTSFSKVAQYESSKDVKLAKIILERNKIKQDKVSNKGRHSQETITENEREQLDIQISRRNMLHPHLKKDYDTAYHPDTVKRIDDTLKARPDAILKENFKQHALFRENLQAVELTKDFTRYLESLQIEPASSSEAAALNNLVTHLVSHTKDFVTPHLEEQWRGKLTYAEYVALTEGALKKFKKEMKHTLTCKPHSIVEKVNDVIRKFLHIFDMLFSKVTGKTTAAETKTFGAKTLTGKDHFFNKPDTLLAKKIEAFHKAIKKADTPKNGAPKFQG
jgi:hypothetical protein